MLFAGDGSELWHVRVDLLAPDRDPSRVSVVADELRRGLRGAHEGRGGGAGVDQGIGVEGQPVVGLTFWVRADDVGSAAVTALETARRAGSAASVGPDYYDVSLVPSSAIRVPLDQHTVDMPD